MRSERFRRSALAKAGFAAQKEAKLHRKRLQSRVCSPEKGAFAARTAEGQRPRKEHRARCARKAAPSPVRCGAPLRNRAAGLRPGGASAGQRLELGARGEPARRHGAASAADAAPPAPLIAEDLPFSGHLLRNSEADVALVRSPTRTSVTNAPFLVPNDTQGPGGRPPLGFTLGISKQVAIFRRNPRKAPLSLRQCASPPYKQADRQPAGRRAGQSRATPSGGGREAGEAEGRLTRACD